MGPFLYTNSQKYNSLQRRSRKWRDWLTLVVHQLMEIQGWFEPCFPTNERRRYKVTPSLIGRAQTYEQPWNRGPTVICFEVPSSIGREWTVTSWSWVTSWRGTGMYIEILRIRYYAGDFKSLDSTTHVRPQQCTTAHCKRNDWLSWATGCQGVGLACPKSRQYKSHWVRTCRMQCPSEFETSTYQSQ